MFSALPPSINIDRHLAHQPSEAVLNPSRGMHIAARYLYLRLTYALTQTGAPAP